jgi:hypothetical protein
MWPNNVCEDKILTDVPKLLAVGLKTHPLSKSCVKRERERERKETLLLTFS